MAPRSLTYAPRRMTSAAREALFDAAGRDGGFPTCRHCGRAVLTLDRWEPDVEPDDPAQAPRGVAHAHCLRRAYPDATPARRSRKDARVRQRHIGAFRSEHPLPGGRGSPLRKKMNGQVVPRFPRANAWGDELDTTLAAVADEIGRAQP